MMETQVRFREGKYILVATDGQKTSEVQNYPTPNTLPLPEPLYCFFKWLQSCNFNLTPFEERIQDLTHDLMPHQKHALGFVLSRLASILALDMGLGKTVIVVASLLVQQPKCAVILAPAGLVANWESELRKFAPGLEYHVVKSGAEEAEVFLRKRLTLIPLSLLDKMWKLVPKHCDFVAVDEAHYVKNINSKLSRAMFKLRNKLTDLKRLVLLTGTPAQQHNHFYGLLRLLNPFFHSWFHFNPHMVGKHSSSHFYFAERYCGAKRLFLGKGGGAPTYTFDFDARREELQALVRPFVFRLLKSEVLDLPEPVQERVIVGSLSKEQAAFFEKGLDHFQETMESKGKKAACSILTDLVLQTIQLKIPFVVKHLEEFLTREPNCKFLCFVDHVSMGDAICQMFDEKKVLHVRVDGRVPRDKRFALLEKVRTTHQVAVVSFGTCSLGFNLNFVHTCFFCERIWKGVEQVQSESRIHRIGQLHDKIRMFRLDLDGSIDVLMERKVKRKLRTEAFLLRDKEHKKCKKMSNLFSDT